MSLSVDDITDAVEVGRGAFGVVYRAHQESLDRTVAVKVLANVDVDDASLARFAREVRAVGRLSGHPNIVAVYAHGTTGGGAPYMLMEFCQSGSYGDALRAGRRLSWQEATEVVIAIAGALESSHRAGILHRDVKPDNILIDGYGVPKLADFGIARQSSHQSMTATGMLTGSPAHVAPDIVAGLEPSAASDIYSLASTLHALITGEPAFVRDTDSSILPLLQRIATAPPPSLQQYGVPAPVADVVLAAMAKEPSDRPASALDFAVALQAARQASGAEQVGFRVMADPAHELPDADATVLPGAAAGASVPRGWAPSGSMNGTPAVGSDATVAGGMSSPAAPSPAPMTAGASAGPPQRGKGRIIAWASAAVGLALIAVAVVSVSLLASAPQPLASASGPPSIGPDLSTGTELDDNDAAAAMLLSPLQVANVTFADWEETPGGGGINANTGFCGVQLTSGPPVFMQNAFHLVVDGPGTLPQVASAGGVFDSAADAEQYMAARFASADCGSWEQGGVVFDVFQPPFTPTLVGCLCQDVTVHEVVASYPDGTSVSQISILAQQDRYVSAIFHSIASEFASSDDVIDAIGSLIDLSVVQVSSAAEQGNG